MAEEELPKMICKQCWCGFEGLEGGSDGFFYCKQCNCQADNIMDTGVADEDFVDKGGDTRGGIYQASHTRRRPSQPPLAEVETQHSQFESAEPADLGSGTGTDMGMITLEDYYREVRKRYVMGM